jgi:SAM-dependent methyltransferase
MSLRSRAAGRARPRGPRGLKPDRNGRDPTFSGWSEALPIAEEHRGTLADAESDAAYRWAAGAVAGRVVLDVGSGPGHGAMVLHRAGAQAVVGVDRDPEAVESATRLYGAHASFLQAEPMALPLAPASFDLVICFRALEEEPDPDAVLDGLRRVLAEDGLLIASLRTRAAQGENGEARCGTRSPEEWRASLSEVFRNVRLYRRRLCVAATVAPAGRGPTLAVDEATWVTGGEPEDRATLVLAGNGALPDLPSVASMTDFRDLRAYRATLAAWEERARRAEAEGSAKHWELVAAREAQRRLRKQLHALEHRPLRMLWRVVRGRPARIGKGPPIRPSERGPERWD